MSIFKFKLILNECQLSLIVSNCLIQQSVPADFTLLLDLQQPVQRLSPLPMFSPSYIVTIGFRHKVSIPGHLDGVGERRLGSLRHEGDKERGEEGDHPEHNQGDLSAVHLELHDKWGDLGECYVKT